MKCCEVQTAGFSVADSSSPGAVVGSARREASTTSAGSILFQLRGPALDAREAPLVVLVLRVERLDGLLR